jgi:hypothetical protein
MKIKLSFLVVCVAILTLSFTFSLKRDGDKVAKQPSEKSVLEEPIGGSGSEDKL